MDEFFGDANDSSSDGQGSNIILGIANDVSSVINTSTIANTNPVNASLITGVPISTPSISTGTASLIGGSGAWLLGGLLLILVIVFGLRRKV